MSDAHDYQFDADHWKEQWGLFANDLRMWALRASELLLAADCLHGPPKKGVERGRGERKFRIARNGMVLGPAMMLYGLCIECLMKAVAVKNGHQFVTEQDGELIFRPLFNKARKCHDLIELSGHADISLSLSPDEQDVARRLTHYIVWGGRYPVAKRWDAGLQPPDRGEYEHNMAWDFSTDYRVIHGLADRLFDELRVERDSDGLVILPDV